MDICLNKNNIKNTKNSLVFVILSFIILLYFNIFCYVVQAKVSSSGCPPLIERKGIKVTCKKTISKDAETEMIKCYSGNIPPGAVAYYICDDYYTSLESFEEPPQRKLKCNDNSKWTGLDLFYAYSCQIECGTMRGLENEKFVIGGKTTTAEKWPWHATIFVAREKQFTYICGGTLVNGFNEGFAILTAAHCLLDDFDVVINPNQLRVVLGGQKSDMIENRNDFHAQVFSVEKVIFHKGYIGEQELHQNDIGILKLEGSVHITNTVSPVCLSSNANLAATQLKIGSYGQVVGFGRYTNKEGKIEEPSPILRQAKLPVVHNDGCYQWQKYHLDYNSQICAGYLNELSVCKGDSGGGYVFPREIAGSSRYYLQGIVSYGYVRNETFCENYGVFTKIHHHSEWIQDQMENMYNPTCSKGKSEAEVEVESQQGSPSKSQEIVEQNQSEELETQTPLQQAALEFGCPVCPEIQIQTVKCPTTIPTTDINHNHDSLITSVNKSDDWELIEKATRVLLPDFPDHSRKNTATSEISIIEGTGDRNTLDTTGSLQVFSFELGGHSDYQNIALTLHNNYRALHGVPPLRINERLSREALAYAHKLIRENSFVNLNPIGENPPTYNKNIFQILETGAKQPTDAVEVVRQAVNYWYSEINKYNWKNPGITTFSQLVWRSTIEIGLGLAVGQQGNGFRQVVVAAYSPPGNMQGAQYFRNNVFPTTRRQ